MLLQMKIVENVNIIRQVLIFKKIKMKEYNFGICKINEDIMFILYK